MLKKIIFFALLTLLYIPQSFASDTPNKLDQERITDHQKKKQAMDELRKNIEEKVKKAQSAGRQN